MKEKETPLVSVIIPTRNRPDDLLSAIGSVISQTYPNIEIIVVNDGGEEVANLLESVKGTIPITYVKHPTRRGPGAARNTGIKKARGKYLAYLDDDDIFYRDHVETLVNFLESSEYKVAYTDAYCALQTKKGGKYITYSKSLLYSYEFDAEMLLVLNFFPTLSVIHDKACIQKVGFFDESLETHEDWDFWIRLSRIYTFKHIPKVTCEYRRRAGGDTITEKKRRDFLKTAKIIYSRYRKYAEGTSWILKAQEKAISSLEAETFIRSIEFPLVCSNRPRDFLDNVTVLIQSSSYDAKKIKEKITKQKKVPNVEIVITGQPLNSIESLTGKYLLMMNEPFEPVNEFWLYNMLVPFINHTEISATTCKSFPNKDDLFSLWLKEQSKKETVNTDRILCLEGTSYNQISFEIWGIALQKIINKIDPLVCCFKREIIIHSDVFPLLGWENGLKKALLSGLSIGVINSTGVIKPPPSALIVLKEEFKKVRKSQKLPLFHFIRNKISFEKIIVDAIHLLEIISLSVASTPEEYISPASFLNSLKKYFESVPFTERAADNPDYTELKKFLELAREKVKNPSSYSTNLKENIYLRDFVDQLHSFVAFSEKQEKRKSWNKSEFSRHLFRIFALVLAKCLGIFCLEQEIASHESKEAEAIDYLFNQWS